MARGDVFVFDETTYQARLRTADRRTVNLAEPLVSEPPVFIFTRPDGTVIRVESIFTTDGSDGLVEYTMVPGQQNLPGVWKIQVEVVFGNGTFRSDVKTLLVQEGLDNP